MRRAIVTIAAVILAAGTVSAVTLGKTIYVDADAAGTNNGTTWPDAYKFLQDALADANSSEKPLEIRVAQGVYQPDRSAAEPNGTGDREATFQLISGVSLKGGYAGFGQPDPNACDVELCETVLSGDLNGDDINVIDLYDLSDEPTRAENSYHVVAGSGTNTTAVLDGFVITGANANGEDYPDHCGGGMYNYQGSPTLIDCVFLLNSAGLEPWDSGGGGMYNVAGGPTLTMCTFQDNFAFSDGGMCNKDSNITLIDCTFRGNAAASCSATSNSHSTVALVECVFADNYSIGGLGAMCNSSSNVTLTGCTFIRNSSGHLAFAGGMANFDSVVALTECAFIANFAYEAGGGMFNIDSELDVTNCTFEDNFAGLGDGRGGGMFNRGTSLQVSNCTFKNNFAYPEEGGGVYIDFPVNDKGGIITNCIFTGNYAPFGGGLSVGDRFMQVRNCVFAGNRADFGGGLVTAGSVSNCIVWNNAASQAPQIAGSVVQFSNIQGGYSGEGNIDAEPWFVDIGHWDDNGTPENPWDDFYVSGDYHLKSQAGRWEPNEGRWTIDDVTSLCIDAGDPMTPIGQEPFPNGGRINMGAYGGTGEASKSYFGEPVCETIVAGDVNGDCKVNFEDFRLMALHWLEVR